MITYRSELTSRPPVPEDVQRQKMAEMKSYAPAGGMDAYHSALDLSAYRRAAERANLQYATARQSAGRQLALSGLGDMYQQQAADTSLAGSLLGSLLR